MKIKIIKKTERNPKSWVNDRIGTVCPVIEKRSADHKNNLTGVDEYVVKCTNPNDAWDSFNGAVACDEVEIVMETRLYVADIWMNDQVLIKGMLATVKKVLGSVVEVCFEDGELAEINPKQVKVMGV